MSRVFARLARIICLSWLGVHWFAPPSAYGADLKTIRERGYLIVAVKDNVRPLGWRNAQGELQGLEIDLARKLAQTILGDADAVKLIPVKNRDRLPLVMNDRVDLAIAQITATIARARLVYFTDPYYLNGTSFITQRDTGITHVQQLSRKPVAVLQNSATVSSLKYHQPNLQLIAVQSYSEAQRKLQSGQVTAFAGSTTVLTGWQQSNPIYHLIPTQLDRRPIAIAYPKGLQYADLGTIVSQSVRQWQQSGWLQERATYWGLPWDRLSK